MNRHRLEEIARSPRRTGHARSRSSDANHPIHRVDPTPPMRSEYSMKPSHSSSLVPPSVRLSPITPRDDGPPTPPTDEVAMIHTAPFREKLHADNSSANEISETLAETLVKGSDNVTHEELDTLRPTSNFLPFSLAVIRVCRAFLLPRSVSFPVISPLRYPIELPPYSIKIAFYGRYRSPTFLPPARNRRHPQYLSHAKLSPGSTTSAVPKSRRVDGVAGALGMGQQKFFPSGL